MKYYSYLLACLMAFFVISCGSDDDAATPSTPDTPGTTVGQYNGADFIALYHGTPQVLASIVTGEKVEMDKWNELYSLFTETPKTRGIIGQSLALVQFAGKMTVISKNANMDIYARLKSKGITYKEMFNQVEPNHRSGYDNAEEWELAMNQGKVTSPYCFSDLATAYALELEDGPGYNKYRYKILANTSVELATEGINVIASFDSDISNAKTAYDFVNSIGARDYETFSSKISGIINETGGEISDVSLYAYKTYLDYCLSNRETDFSWLPKNNEYFGSYWYEKIDDNTEYEYLMLFPENMVNEKVTRKTWQKGNEEPLSKKEMTLTLYCGKENYILYLTENGKTVPYRIVNTGGDHVNAKNSYFYMMEVGGTKRRLWKRQQYYSHEKPVEDAPAGIFSAEIYVGGDENSTVKDQDGTTYYLHNYSDPTHSNILCYAESKLKDSKVTYSGNDAIITYSLKEKDDIYNYSLTVKNYKDLANSYISSCNVSQRFKFTDEDTESREFTTKNIPFKRKYSGFLEYELTQASGKLSDFVTDYKHSFSYFIDDWHISNYTLPKSPKEWYIRILLHYNKE